MSYGNQRLLAAGGCALLVKLVAAAADPAIEMTHVPPFGSFQNLTGTVANVNVSTCRVAVVIYIPGAGWWSKPYCNPQLTSILPSGAWFTDITTGGVDERATWITTMLVSSNYSEPCVEGATSIPANVLARALATATVTRVDPAIRRIRFSGYEWWVKASAGAVGPGPNYFSDSTNNVWVDGSDRLHLRITHRSNQWQCAEIVSSRSFGYGSYRFELGTSVNPLNANAVLGLFTWSDDPAYAHREIDVECSRWGNPGDANNSQFVVQPWDTAEHLKRYAVPGAATNSTHLFIWETNRVVFKSQRNSYQPTPPPAEVISNWTYTLQVPVPGDENVRLNLWLMNGTPPGDGQEVEFIINSFQFVPPGAPAPARLLNPGHSTNGQFRFELNGQVDRRYQVETSTNLSTWATGPRLLATNAVMIFVDTNTSGSAWKMYRTLTLP